MAIEHRLRVKYNQTLAKYQGHFTKPAGNFYRQTVYGILKSRHVHLSKMARSLNEEISLKKTWSCLSRQVGRRGLWETVMNAHIWEIIRSFRSSKYWVLDLTDVNKIYANAMEGLGVVYDGSREETGNGYNIVNAAGVSPKTNSISLMYSELYSLVHEAEKHVSENSKILGAVSFLRNHLGVSRPVVIDRGGDRRVLYENFLKKPTAVYHSSARRSFYLHGRKLGKS